MQILGRIAWLRRAGRFGGCLTPAAHANMIEFKQPSARRYSPGGGGLSGLLIATTQGAMSIWNKVLVGLILVASLGFFYLALRTLKTHQYWRNLASGYELLIKRHQEIAGALTNGGEVPVSLDHGINELRSFYRDHEHALGVQQGATWPEFENGVLRAVAKTGLLDPQLVRNCTFKTEDAPGINRLRLELHKMLANRGRVWNRCDAQPTAQTPKTGQVLVSTDSPGIPEKTLLFVFEEAGADQGGDYLGAFEVATFEALDQNGNGSLEQGELPAPFQPQFAAADADGNAALDLDEFNAVKADYPGPESLQPSMKMGQAELKRLAASAAGKATWALCEKMPPDSHEAFDHLSEEELKKLFPAESQEYLKDGQLLTAEEARQLGLRGSVVAVDENGNVVYEDQDGNVVYVSTLDEKGRLVYVDEDGQFAYAATVKENVDPNGEIIYEAVYVDQSGRELPGASLLPKEVVKGQGMYRRPLRDYEVLLKEYRLERALLADRKEAASRDLAFVQTSLAQADRQREFRQREKALLIEEEKKQQDARDAVDRLRQRLTGELNDHRDSIKNLIAKNRAMAGEIERIQMEATRRIDARTRRVAHSGAGETGKKD